jgi:hypothetical protein
MGYSAAPSPISYPGGVQMGGGPLQQQQQQHRGGPGTPGIITSPQDGNNEMNFNMMKQEPSGMQVNEQHHIYLMKLFGNN